MISQRAKSRGPLGGHAERSLLLSLPQRQARAGPRRGL